MLTSFVLRKDIYVALNFYGSAGLLAHLSVFPLENSFQQIHVLISEVLHSHVVLLMGNTTLYRDKEDT